MNKDSWDTVRFVVSAFILTWLIVLTIFGVIKLGGYLFDVPCSAFASKEEQKRCGL